MEIIAKNKKLIIIILMILIIVFCIVKLIPMLKEDIREKQEIPLSQNFINTFHENFEYGMTGQEIKNKLGEPYKIASPDETRGYIWEENEYGGYLDSSRFDWLPFDSKIKTKEGYISSSGVENGCYIYEVKLDEESNIYYAYFYLKDGYFSSFNIITTL